MSKFLVANGFAIAYAVAFELTYQGGPYANRPSFLWLGLILGCLSLYTFFLAGSSYVLFASILSYGQALFVASPAILIGLGRDDLRQDLNPSAALIFLTFFFIVQLLVFLGSSPLPRQRAVEIHVDGSLQFLALGLAGLAAGVGYLELTSSLASGLESLTLAAIVLSSVVTFSRQSIQSLLAHGTCLLLITGLYALYQFDGYGRLVFATYLLSVGVVFSWMNSTYLVKFMAILATVPGVALLTIRRTMAVEQAYGREVAAEDTLGSVFGPFQSGAYIFQEVMAGAVEPRHGESILTSLLFWIPRSIWHDKPPGFGRAIVPVVQPDMVSVKEHSAAAPFIAEYIWDFGMLGLLLGGLLVVAILKLDAFIAKMLFDGDGRLLVRNRTFLIAALAVFVGMFPNYVWGSSFTYLSRALIPGVFLLTLFLVSSRRTKTRVDRSSDSVWSVVEPFEGGPPAPNTSASLFVSTTHLGVRKAISMRQSVEP